VGIGFSLLLLVKAAGNYSMKPLKTDPATGEFIPVDDLQYQVHSVRSGAHLSSTRLC